MAPVTSLSRAGVAFLSVIYSRVPEYGCYGKSGIGALDLLRVLHMRRSLGQAGTRRRCCEPRSCAVPQDHAPVVSASPPRIQFTGLTANRASARLGRGESRGLRGLVLPTVIDNNRTEIPEELSTFSLVNDIPSSMKRPATLW